MESNDWSLLIQSSEQRASEPGKRTRSMLPPDTMATTVPRTCPVSAAATAHAGCAFDHHMTAIGDEPHRGGDVRQRHDDETTRRARESSGHIVGSTDLPPAPSTNDACQPSKRLARPLRSDVASGAAVSGSAAMMRVSGLTRSHRRAHAAQQPAAANRADDGVHVAADPRGSRGRASVPGDEAVVVERDARSGRACAARRALRRCASIRRRWR